jgi:single-strand DNA-binding protein
LHELSSRCFSIPSQRWTDRLTNLQEDSMNELPFYGIGNLTDDPEVRVTPNGNAVANMTIATTARRYDRQSKAWVQGDTTYLKLVVWNEQAEAVADSLRRGMRVIVPGSLDAADL